jgi:hypothetical protein
MMDREITVYDTQNVIVIGSISYFVYRIEAAETANESIWARNVAPVYRHLDTISIQSRLFVIRTNFTLLLLS